MKIHIHRNDYDWDENSDLIYTKCGIILIKSTERDLYRKSACKSVTCKKCLKAK